MHITDHKQPVYANIRSRILSKMTMTNYIRFKIVTHSLRQIFQEQGQLFGLGE